MHSKIFVLNTCPCVRQNPTVNDYLPAIGLVSCNMDTGQINLILHSKDGSHLCTVPAVRKEWARRTGPPISDQGQGLGVSEKVEDKYIYVHVPLKFIHLTYEYIHTWGILCISEEFLTVQIKGLFNTFGTA